MTFNCFLASQKMEINGYLHFIYYIITFAANDSLKMHEICHNVSEMFALRTIMGTFRTVHNAVV